MSEKSAWEAEAEKIRQDLAKIADPDPKTTLFLDQDHSPLKDDRCPLCKSDRRILLEKWYVKREKTLKQLAKIFGFDEFVISQHCQANKLGRKRNNNTQALVSMILDKGEQALADGTMEITMKDLAWAVGHRDKLLGRIVDKQKIQIAPVVHVHTSIPGVGGILNSDVKEKEQLENREPVAIPAVILEAETVEITETNNDK